MPCGPSVLHLKFEDKHCWPRSLFRRHFCKVAACHALKALGVAVGGAGKGVRRHIPEASKVNARAATESVTEDRRLLAPG